MLEWVEHTDPEMGREDSINVYVLRIRVNDAESEVWRRCGMDGSDGDDHSDQDEKLGQRTWSVSAVSVLQPSRVAGWYAPCLICARANI